MIRVGVLGFGYWGPNIVRNFEMTEGASVAAICDIDDGAVAKAKRLFPQIHCTKDYRSVINSPDIDSIAVITPVNTHFELAKLALTAGKSVFVDKPFMSSVKQAEQIIELAEKKNLMLMVDHTFLFTGAVRKIKELIDADVLGKLYYFDSMRINLGLFQHDVNVIWDLAPHDFSIMDRLIADKPLAISAHGIDHFGRNLEHTAYITVYFSDKIAHINVNWLSPVKVRTTLIGGDKKMLVWNDMESDEKIKIYDRGVEIDSKEGVYNLVASYRSGDMSAPRIDMSEALITETNYFVRCLNSKEKPFNDGESGLRVVKMLEVCNESLKNKGKLIELRNEY